jgi:hypothetical protein
MLEPEPGETPPSNKLYYVKAWIRKDELHKTGKNIKS